MWLPAAFKCAAGQRSLLVLCFCFAGVLACGRLRYEVRDGAASPSVASDATFERVSSDGSRTDALLSGGVMDGAEHPDAPPDATPNADRAGDVQASMFDTAAADVGDALVDAGLAEGASGDSGVPPGLAIVFYPVGAGTFEVTAVEVAPDGGVFVGGVVRDRYSVSGTIIGSVGGPPHGVVLHANPAGAVDWVRVIAPSGVAGPNSPMEVTSFAFTEGKLWAVVRVSNQDAALSGVSIEGGRRPTEVRGSAAFHVVAYEPNGDLDSVASFGRGRDASAFIASGGSTTVISGYQRNVAGPLVINGTTLIAREQMGYAATYLARLAPPDTGRSVREFTGTGGFFFARPFVAPDGAIFAGGSFDGTVELGARTLRAGARGNFDGFLAWYDETLVLTDVRHLSGSTFAGVQAGVAALDATYVALWGVYALGARVTVDGAPVGPPGIYGGALAKFTRAGAVSWFVGFGNSNVFVNHVVVDEARSVVHAAAYIVNDTTIDGRLYTFRGGARGLDGDIVVISFDAAAGTITRVEAIAGTGGDVVRDMRAMPDGRVLLGGYVNDGATASDYPTLLGPVISTSLTGFVYLMP